MNRKIKLIVVLFMTGLTTLCAQDWKHDFEEAKEIASKEDKTIILVFQGSDWCAPCIKLDREVWSTKEFQTYAKEHYIMLQADFPRRKKNKLPEEQLNANKKLAEQYNQMGVFPLVVVLDKDGNVLGETSYKKMGPKKYIALLNNFIK
ncbi:thioredoxin family protein [Maribacter thermophilus]|uniref:thioredoxin family protein n=1 Tax=Maribacter thermophilus TaxID=1197874 RepID=UPI000ADC1ECE